ncbi:hypothetical protein VXQ18_01620 [Brucella abortus]|nr:hypothetical protein [Brucella abortus]
MSGRGLVYSRFNHPNSEIVEDRLAVYEGRKVQPFSRPACPPLPPRCRFVRPGDVILHSAATLWRHGNAWRRPSSLFGVECCRVFADGVHEATIYRVKKQPKRCWRKGRASVIRDRNPLANPGPTVAVDVAAVRRVAEKIESAAGQPPGHRLRHSLLAGGSRSLLITGPISRSIR